MLFPYKLLVFVCLATGEHFSARGWFYPLCQEDSDCSHKTDSVCDINSGQCVCPEDYILSLDGSRCLKLARYMGDECEVTEQCLNLDAAHCVNGQCNRRPEPAMMETMAMEDPFHRTCTQSWECDSAHAVCVHGTCECDSYFVYSKKSKMCLEEANLHDYCDESIQCAYENGVCLEGTCGIDTTTTTTTTTATTTTTTTTTTTMTNHPGDSAGKEKRVLLLGSTCDRNEDCAHLDNAVCTESICECTENYVTSVMANTCLPMAKEEGEPCEVDKQCEGIKGATCGNGKCVRVAVAGRSHGPSGFGNGASAMAAFPTMVLTLATVLPRVVKDIFR